MAGTNLADLPQKAFGGFKFGGFQVLTIDDITEYGNEGGPLAMVSCRFSSAPSNLSSLFRVVADVGAASRTALLDNFNSVPHQAQELAS